MDKTYLSYVKEITEFLNNLVIKFDPFVTALNENGTYLAISGYDADDPTTYPYYRILQGDVAFATTDIYGYSSIQQANIILTRSSVDNNKDVVNFYKHINNFNDLISRYKEDEFIVRRLINPVDDINFAINAKNLTIIPTRYTDTYLNEYERDDILIFLQNILWNIDYRWYMNPLEFEDMYPYTFWAALWNLLPYILLSRRIQNIRTVNVHPFHIWEYLKSLGFEGYEGYLDRFQEMFLYRNAKYLKFHGGKDFLLSILEKVFLNPIKYSLVKKTIFDHTLNRQITHDKYPEVIYTKESSNHKYGSTSFDILLDDIYKSGYDSNNDITYLNSITDRFIKSNVNKLDTKFLAFMRNIDMEKLMFLLQIILDEIVYLTHSNKLDFPVEIQSPITQNILMFDDTFDALTFLYYCIYKLMGRTAVNTFEYYRLTTALTCDEAPVIDDYFHYHEKRHLIKSYFDIDKFLTTIPFINEVIYNTKDLSYAVGDVFDWMFDKLNELRATSDSVVYEINRHVLSKVSADKVVKFEKKYETFEEFFNHYSLAYDDINKISESSQYVDFIYSTITGICPLEYGFLSLANDDEAISILIKKIKELFVYLVSYNITFLNTDIDKTICLDIPKITGHIYHEDITTYSGGSSINVIDDTEDTESYYITISINNKYKLRHVNSNDAEIETISNGNDNIIDVNVDEFIKKRMIIKYSQKIYYNDEGITLTINED